jgi:hypothetical protein
MVEPDRLAEKSISGAGPHARDGDQERSKVCKTHSQLTRNGVTAGSGHIHIRDHHIRPEQPAQVERIVAAKDNLDVVSLVTQDEREHVGRVAVVIRYQDAKRSPHGNAWTRRYDVQWDFGAQSGRVT